MAEANTPTTPQNEAVAQQQACCGDKVYEAACLACGHKWEKRSKSWIVGGTCDCPGCGKFTDYGVNLFDVLGRHNMDSTK